MDMDSTSLKRIHTFMEVIQRAKQVGIKPSFINTPTEHGDNINVVAKTMLPTPADIKAELPIGAKAEATVLRSRQIIQDIIDGRDSRLFAVVGPCSIHDIDAALEYAGRLKSLAQQVNDSLFVVMRVYFEKPRTTVGWKGLINDPDMDD